MNQPEAGIALDLVRSGLPKREFALRVGVELSRRVLARTLATESERSMGHLSHACRRPNLENDHGGFRGPLLKVVRCHQVESLQASSGS